MYELKNKVITSPGSLDGFNDDDGLGIFGEGEWYVHDCVISLANVPLDKKDEALAFTRGASGIVERCRISGAGKLILCGGGDAEYKPVEQGKCVTFYNCVFEHFGRRGPEVQCGMRVVLQDCIIRMWGEPSEFTVRSFGAWAHDDGAIVAESCLFLNEPRGSFMQRVTDIANHIGQAVNDEGLGAIFRRKSWLPGWRRGLVSTDSGHVEARNCWTNDPRIVIENHIDPMTDSQAEAAMARINGNLLRHGVMAL